MLEDDQRNDEEVQTAAMNLFVGVAPERNAELSDLWQRYTPRFNFIMDNGPDGAFVMEAGLYREVRFNDRAMRAFWLAAFIGWEGYRSVHEGLVRNDFQLTRFNEMIDCFTELLNADDPLTVTLPEGVPDPGVYVDGTLKPDAKAAADLATFACGWALLHEVRHIKHQQDKTGAPYDAPPVERRREELSCDEFATRFLLDHVEDYATRTKEPADGVRQKRAIGIYFALFALTLISKDNWEESDSHPAMQTRIDAVIRQIGTDGTRMSDAIAHAAHAALWCSWPVAPGPFKSKVGSA